MKFVTRNVIAVLAALGALLALVAMAPSASAYPGGTGGVSVGTSTPTAGGSLAVNGTDCRPNSTVSISLAGGAVLGTAPTNGSGVYSTTVQLPPGVTGAATISVTGAQCAATAGVEVQAASTGSGTGTGTGGSGSGSGLASTGVAVVGLGALGVVLLIGGGLMLLAGRRRKISA